MLVIFYLIFFFFFLLGDLRACTYCRKIALSYAHSTDSNSIGEDLNALSDSASSVSVLDRSDSDIKNFFNSQLSYMAEQKQIIERNYRIKKPSQSLNRKQTFKELKIFLAYVCFLKVSKFLQYKSSNHAIHGRFVFSTVFIIENNLSLSIFKPFLVPVRTIIRFIPDHSFSGSGITFIYVFLQLFYFFVVNSLRGPY